MYQAPPFKDNEQITVKANPKGTSGLQAVPTGSLSVVASDQNFIECIVPAQTFPNSDPHFMIRPKSRFFGPDRQVTINISGAVVGGGGATKTTPMGITVQGSLPDDGTLDHFEPTSEPPVPQS